MMMNFIDIVASTVSILVVLTVIGAIVYVPYFAILYFIEKTQPKFYTNVKRYKSVNPSNYKHLITTFESIVGMLTKIAKSDGVISELEADVIKDSITHFLSMAHAEGVSSSEVLKLRQKLVQAHKEAKVVNIPISVYAKKLVNYDLYVKKQVMQQLIFMASLDGYTKLKESLIFNAGGALGFEYVQMKRYIDDILGFKKHQPKNKNVYEILGSHVTDDMSLIKKRYRALVKKYHPDFIQSNGYNDKTEELAKQKMQEINQAYADIKRQRG